MKLKKKALVAALGAMMVSGAASAVQVNRAGLGDLLIAPAYMIGGGWQTQFRVVNTSMTDSVVAKVVVHHNVTSGELLDFLIYLSPGDEWLGTMSCTKLETNGVCTTAQFASTDDSVQVAGSSAFATATTPSVFPIKAPATYGYVTITESSSYAVAPRTPGVAKAAILAAHNAAVAAGAAVATTATPNVLTGTATVLNGVSQASLPMLALADYNNLTNLTTGGLTEIGIGAAASRADVEDALWNNSLVVPYQVDATSSTLATFTYPTKLTYKTSNVGGQYAFNLGAASTVCVNPVAFDMSENFIGGPNYSPTPPPICTPEAGWVVVGDAANGVSLTQVNGTSFTSGWVNFGYAVAQNSVGQVQATAQNSLTGAGNVWDGGLARRTAGAPGIVTYFNVNGSQLNWQYAPSY